MSRLWQGGAELQNAALELTAVSGAVGVSTTIKHGGAASWRVNPTNAVMYGEVAHTTTDEDTFYSIWLYVATFPSATVNIFSNLDGSNLIGPHFDLANDGTLSFRGANNDTPANALVGSTTLSTGQWYNLQFKAVAAGTEGRVNGVSLGTRTFNFQGQKCRFGTLAAASADMYFDDGLVNNTAGTVENSWPHSDSMLAHLRPSGAGDNAAWVQGAGGTAEWNRVSETTPDDATTYNKRITGTPTDDHAMDDSATAGIGAGDTVVLVAVGWRMGAISTTATGRSGIVRIKSQAAGTVLESASLGMNVNGWSTNKIAAPQTYPLVSYTEPQAGGAWTPALLDSMQAGYRAPTSSTNEIRVTTLWASVEYVPAAGGAPQTVSPGGVGTAEVFGTAQLNLIVFPAGVVSAEAFGVARLDITIFPVALASGETFGVAVVTAQNLISPSGVVSAETFGAAVVSATNLISPTAIASAEAFGAATVMYDVVVSPGGLASGEAFGVPQLNLTVFPAGVTTAEAFGAAALIANYTMNPVGVVSSEAFGTALLTTQNTILPSGIPSGETFGLAAVLAANTVSPAGIAGAEAVGAHTVSPGTAIILPPGVASAEAFGIPDVGGGVQALVQALKSLLAIGIRL